MADTNGNGIKVQTKVIVGVAAGGVLTLMTALAGHVWTNYEARLSHIEGLAEDRGKRFATLEQLGSDRDHRLDRLEIAHVLLMEKVFELRGIHHLEPGPPDVGRLPSKRPTGRPEGPP